MDYSDWTIAPHKRVVILTILADHSRFITSCRAYPLATVGNVIESFTNTDNHKCPRRARDRVTPAEAYNALSRAKLKPIQDSHDFLLRTEKVTIIGKAALRWRRKLRRLYIGRRWCSEADTMICVDNHVDIKLISTGAQIAT